MIDFTHKTAKYMIDHIKKQCLTSANTKKKDQLRDMEFPWNPEEDIIMKSTKLNKEQERLKK